MTQQQQPGKKTKNQKKHDAKIASATVWYEDYVQDGTKLEIWQRLCRDLGVEAGSSITQCRKIVDGVYVNIFDFQVAQETGKPVRTFRNLYALRNYSQHGKYFPLAQAKENFVLRALLVHMSGYRR